MFHGFLDVYYGANRSFKISKDYVKNWIKNENYTVVKKKDAEACLKVGVYYDGYWEKGFKTYYLKKQTNF